MLEYNLHNEKLHKTLTIFICIEIIEKKTYAVSPLFWGYGTAPGQLSCIIITLLEENNTKVQQ